MGRGQSGHPELRFRVGPYLRCCLLPSRCLLEATGVYMPALVWPRPHPIQTYYCSLTRVTWPPPPGQALPPPGAEGKPGRCLLRLQMAGIFHF